MEESNRKKVFYGSKEVDYNRPDTYAFLNWRFDDGYGENSKDENSIKLLFQMASDNYQMGKGYYGNAMLTLNTLINEKNICNVADLLIFPILFSLWHGTELWLKSSLMSLDILFGEENFKKNHKIIDLYDKLLIRLKNENLYNIIDLALPCVHNLICEFERVNANFDFARYSFDGKNNFQFYNAPYDDEKQWQQKESEVDGSIVPNTCVDIMELMELSIMVFESFGTFTECLLYVIENGEVLTNEGYSKYIESIINFENSINEKNQNTFIQKLLLSIV